MTPQVVVVADDGEMVHLVTDFVLKDLTFEDRPVKLLNTSSAEETRSRPASTVIRTGQAGYKDKGSVVERYDINGYT